MTFIATPASKNGILNSTGVKEQLDLGFLYIYAGPIPATADAALDMVNDHTELVKISVSGGATGLTFATPSAGVVSKNGGEVWTGTCAFSGADGATSTLTPTFYRFCAAGDDGRGTADASTGYRVQGSVGGPSSGADLQLGTDTLTDGNTQPIGAFSITIG